MGGIKKIDRSTPRTGGLEEVLSGKGIPRLCIGGAFAGLLLLLIIVSPAACAVISGHVYQGNPGDYSRPVSSARLLIVPTANSNSYVPYDVQAETYTNSYGSYSFRFTPQTIGVDPLDPEYYFLILFVPSEAEYAGAYSPYGEVTSSSLIRFSYPFQSSEMIQNDFWIVYSPNADFTMNSNGGAAPLTVYFTDRSTGSPSSWSWNFGNGQTSSARDPSVTYTTAGTYKVILTVSNAAGSDSASGTIPVSNPTLSLSPTSGKSGERVTVTGSEFNLFAVEFPYVSLSFNGVVLAGNIPMTASGSLGSFTTSFTVPEGTSPGTYTVRADGPKDSATATFTIANDRPEARIDASPKSGKSPLEVHFDGSRSSDPDGSISSYRWDFGDGGSETGVAADHTYTKPGSKNAVLTVTDNEGATGTAGATIEVGNSGPVAIAKASRTSGSAPLKITFDGSDSYDPDGKIQSYYWAFGDGGWDDTSITSHQYNDLGTYRAVLTVTDEFGQTGKEEVGITVGNDAPVARISLNPHEGSLPLTVTFDGSGSSDTDDDDMIFLWDFGDGNYGNSEKTTHTYQDAGTYHVSLTVTDPHGATGSTSDTVSVEEQSFPWWLVVIGGLGIAGGLQTYNFKITKPHEIGPGQSMPEKCKCPHPKPGYDFRTGVECNMGEHCSMPDVSVEFKSGIRREGE